MSRTWGYVFTRIGGTTQAFLRSPPTHVWLVRYYRRIGGGDCKVTATLTQHQAEQLAAKHGIALPVVVEQLTIIGAPVRQLVTLNHDGDQLKPAWSAVDQRLWDERPPPIPGA